MDPSSHGIRGLASVFGNLDSYDTVVDRGAFAREVADFRRGRTLPLVSRHNTLRDPSAEPIGVVTHLEETEAGLYYESRIDNTQVGRDALARVNSGSSSDASFSFQPVRSYLEEGRRVVRKSGIYEFLGGTAWWDGGGRDVWAEWSGRGEDGTDHQRIVLPTREALAMVKAAKKVNGWGDHSVVDVYPLRVMRIEHFTELAGVRELGPSPARLGANPKAYAEVFDLGEAKKTNAAPQAAGNNLAEALAAATQEISK